MHHITWIDITMFFGMLIVSAFIGIYFAYFAPDKQNTVSQYLMGGRTMGVFPVSMSLIASYISGISILGLPAEMYVYGTQYFIVTVSITLSCITMALVYLPVFYKLQITSSYDYLNKRFGYSVKLLGSVLFLIKQMLYIPIVIYVPALAFNQVTGMHLHLVTPIVCAICIFYTCVGGIKAVVWTDTFQIMIMMLGMIVVLIMGLFDLGSIGVVFERAAATKRLEFFNFDFDLRTRATFWSILIGDFVHTLSSCSANQAMVQRCLSLPNIRKANISVGLLAIGYSVIAFFCCFTGLVIYATFYKCDPLITKEIQKADQLLPLFVTKIAGNVPGLTGIFLSGVFSASLSTMSTGLNSMTGVIYEDMVKVYYEKPISENDASKIMKVVVVLIGILCVVLVFVVEQLGTLIEVGTCLGGITNGALLGMFTLGMFFPWINEKGALFGGLGSLLIMAWISINSQIQISRGNIIYPKKEVTIQGCSQISLANASIDDLIIKKPNASPFYLYGISYFWYSVIGVFITILIGFVVSYATGFNKSKNIDRDLLTPVIHRFLPKCKKLDVNGVEITNFKEKESKEEEIKLA